MTKIDDMREAFEAWYGSKPEFGNYIYTSPLVQARWEAWQAAASQQPDVEALIAEVEAYFLDDKCEKISVAFALTIFDIIRKWAKGEV